MVNQKTNTKLIAVAQIVLGAAMLLAGLPSIYLIFEKAGYYGLSYVSILIVLIGLLIMLDRRAISKALRNLLVGLLFLLICMFLYIVIREGWFSLVGFVGVILVAGGVHLVVETLKSFLNRNSPQNYYQNSFEAVLGLLMTLGGALISLGTLVVFAVDLVRRVPLFEYISVMTLMGPMLLAGGLLILSDADSDKAAILKRHEKELRKEGKRASKWKL